MKNEIEKFNDLGIKDKIYSIRGMQVMLDRDLAELYEVETRRLNEQVKRNKERFPKDFCFLLNNSEYTKWRSQFAMSKNLKIGLRWKPYAFTEQGVAMLSGVLKSKTAIRISISIIKAFVEMRKFINSNSQIFQRLDRIEFVQFETNSKLIENDRKFDKVFSALESNDLKPKQGIFFEGQIFDAYLLVSNLIKRATNSIILIDNYIDESIFILFSERNIDCNVIIYTKKISKKLELSLKKYNEQYPVIEIKELKNSHDRFLILDEEEIYHIGASIKDLGKKWFAFSKLDKVNLKILERLSINN